MKLRVKAPKEYYLKVVADLVRLFFPRVEIIGLVDQRLNDLFTSTAGEEEIHQGEGLLCFAEVIKTDRVKKETDEERENAVLDPASRTLVVSLQLAGKRAAARVLIPKLIPGDESVNVRRRLIRRATLQVLEEITGQSAGPWGILTGIRPTKIVHRRLDQDWGAEQVADELCRDYWLEPTKAKLLVQVAQRQRPFLLSRAAASRLVSVYIGIPFCPTRCLYCSFPSYPLPRNGQIVGAFLQALLQEIQRVGVELQHQGIGVQSIYVGGGTPTSLTADQLRQLLFALRENLPFSRIKQLQATKTNLGDIYRKNEVTATVEPPLAKIGEFTVEAGRPDTLDRSRLAAMQEAGVNRLSINPQTMQDKTLRLIGRPHSAADTEHAFELARQFGFSFINMDVILGLPGETSGDVAVTLEKIGQLGPENLSVHTLAIKRASRLNEQREQWVLPGVAEVEAMVQISQAAAVSQGMEPYYLYRQKHILGNLENVGYCRPGWESVYNIQVMEERQTIIGLGGGAGSKWLNPADWTLTNTYNSKDPLDYIQRIDEIIRKKIDRIQGLS